MTFRSLEHGSQSRAFGLVEGPGDAVIDEDVGGIYHPTLRSGIGGRRLDLPGHALRLLVDILLRRFPRIDRRGRHLVASVSGPSESLILLRIFSHVVSGFHVQLHVGQKRRGEGIHERPEDIIGQGHIWGELRRRHWPLR